MKENYFDRNENILKKAKSTLKNIFLYSGADDVSEYDMKRCIEELGNFCDIVEKNRLTKNEVLNIKNPVTNIINNAIHIVKRVSAEEKKKLQPIEVFFDRYKKENKVNEDDFGLNGFYKKRKKECVYNRVMFTRFAVLNGYIQRDIARLLNIERSVVSHYVHYYKTPNFVNEN